MGPGRLRPQGRRGCSSEVERQLPKLNVGGSIPPTRSNFPIAIKFRPHATGPPIDSDSREW
jgi:hypothetical protein